MPTPCRRSPESGVARFIAVLIQSGLTESLAGRFEVIPAPHWSFTEMSEALAGLWSNTFSTAHIPAPPS